MRIEQRHIEISDILERAVFDGEAFALEHGHGLAVTAIDDD